MTSEKWFDWDTSDNSQPAEPNSTDEQAQPHPENPGETPEQDLPALDATWDAGMVASPEAQPSADPAPADAGSLSSLDGRPDEDYAAMAVAGADAEPRTSTQLRQLHVQQQPMERVDAARPFHLWITGPLKSFEKERLIELITREDFGIREVDLELQLETGRLLLPRISEYAAVLVAQALRGASVEFRMLPSDQASPDQYPGESTARIRRSESTLAEARHPAEEIPVITEDAMPGHADARPMDVLLATGLIREPEWKAESSDAYSELIEALKRELRFKAHLKSADALVKFESRILSNPWISETECRVQVSALAVRFKPH